MKSKFAKFIDYTVGAFLVFLAAAAVFAYYTTPTLAVFGALSVTACVCLILHKKNAHAEQTQRLSSAANQMFYDFMFAPPDAPVRLLLKGLKEKSVDAVRHGNGVYVGNKAVFCFADAPTDEQAARLFSKARHFGATEILVLCKTPAKCGLNVDGMKISFVCGDDVYKLFASLNALPQSKFPRPAHKRFAAFKGAFDKDKIAKYGVLAAAMFALYAFTGRNTVTFVCAVICAALAVASLALYSVAAIRRKHERLSAK